MPHGPLMMMSTDTTIVPIVGAVIGGMFDLQWHPAESSEACLMTDALRLRANGATAASVADAADSIVSTKVAHQTQ
jgi:hypothetical protein